MLFPLFLSYSLTPHFYLLDVCPPLTQIQTYQTTLGIAGVEEAVGQGGDGPALFVEDLGFGELFEGVGLGLSDNQPSSFAEDDEFVAGDEYGTCSKTILLPFDIAGLRIQAGKLAFLIDLSIKAIDIAFIEYATITLVAHRLAAIDLLDLPVVDLEQTATGTVA